MGQEAQDPEEEQTETPENPENIKEADASQEGPKPVRQKAVSKRKAEGGGEEAKAVPKKAVSKRAAAGAKDEPVGRDPRKTKGAGKLGKESPETSRRKFITRLGWGGFVASVLVATGSLVRAMFPRVLFEPSPLFKSGYPEEYQVGTVSDRWLGQHRVWIVREEEGFYALSAICTHLGCTPRWFAIEDKFKCPCHGSGFKMSGVNYEGPAPRPLERVKITLAQDGQLLVDRSVKFLYEKGQWDKPGAFLKV